MNYSRDILERTMSHKGYKYFTSDNYDVNIIGIRNSNTNGAVTNKFDDILTLSYKNEYGDWHYHEFDCTTDPGTHWVNNLLNPDGVAILKPGQYRGSHKIRLHQGKYEALGQTKPVRVYRDDNLDDIYDISLDNVDEGIFGINIHRATGKPGVTSSQIDKWSAGCQVVANYNDFEFLMTICHKAKSIWGNSFSYTLLESKDLQDD